MASDVKQATHQKESISDVCSRQPVGPWGKAKYGNLRVHFPPVRKGAKEGWARFGTLYEYRQRRSEDGFVLKQELILATPFNQCINQVMGTDLISVEAVELDEKTERGGNGPTHRLTLHYPPISGETSGRSENFGSFFYDGRRVMLHLGSKVGRALRAVFGTFSIYIENGFDPDFESDFVESTARTEGSDEGADEDPF